MVTPAILTAALSFCIGQANVRQDCFGDPLPEHAIARMGTQRLRHGARVNGVCFSSDEKTLFTAGGDNTVRQWDVATGKLIRHHTGHGLGFDAIAISPNGATLAAACGSADARVYVWDAVSGKQLDVIEGEEDIHGLEFSADSRTLAWISLEHRLGLWDRESKTKRAIRIPRQDFDDATYCVALSPDGKQAVVGENRGRVMSIELASGKILRKWRHEGMPSSVECVRFTKDGTKIATAGGLNVPIRLWDATTGKLLHELKLERQWDRCVAISPDDKMIVSQRDANVIFWDVETGKQQRTIALPARDYAMGFAFTRDGKTLAIAHDGGAVSLHDVHTGKLRVPLEAHRSFVRAAGFFDDGRSIVTGSHDGTIRIWDAATGTQRRTLSCGDSWPMSMALPPDGKSIVWGSGRIRQTVHVLDVASGKETNALKGHTLSVSSLAISPNGSRMISVAGTKVKLWDLSTSKCLATRDFEYATWVATYLPDGKRFVAACNGLSICDGHTLKPLATFPEAPEIANVAVSADGKTMATISCGIDYAIRIWDVESRKNLAAIETPNGVHSLAISPDAKRLAFSRSFDPEISIWDLSARKSVQTLKGHFGSVNSLTFSSDGRRLISTSPDSTAIVWDVEK